MRGNADRELIAGEPSGYPKSDWAATQLRPDQVELLAGLPDDVTTVVCPGAAEWADEYLRSRNSDTGAVLAFGPRDGRQGPDSA